MSVKDIKAIQNLRVISMEQITKAKSGHPGIALGAAGIVHTLYNKVLKINPKDPKWPNRDRFILSAGHGSSLLYATMHVAGYDITVEDLKQFRQLGSLTPGHPEITTPGVDASTGPLGQGIAMAVGMAIGEAHMGALVNKEDCKIIDHYVYALCGDGDLQEGISQEAMSLAGHLGLNKLIVLYDSNDIQLDGKVSDTCSDDVKGRVEACGWNYGKVLDGEDVDAILAEIEKAKKSTKPTLIEVKTIIGLTSSKAGTADVHGAPLDSQEVEHMRKALGNEPFTIDSEVYEYYQEANQAKLAKYNQDQETKKQYQEKYPEDYAKYVAMLNDEFEYDLSMFEYDENYNKATRVTAGVILREMAKQNPMIFGGAADLSKSTNARCDNRDFTKDDYAGKNIYFGVREAAMTAITNALALYGGFRAFSSGFMVFCDYMKPGIRLSAMMKLPTVYIFSHDTVAVGEDGPTHQPVEQLTMLRSMPNVNVIRPATAAEVRETYKVAFTEKETPSAIILTRQTVQEVFSDNPINVKQGAYIFRNEDEKLDAILLATGSEVATAAEVKAMLKEKGIDVRVVSMPCNRLFDLQSEEYKQTILPKGVKTIAIEASEAIHLLRYADELINIETFGVSAPASKVLAHVGMVKEEIYNKVYNMLK